MKISLFFLSFLLFAFSTCPIYLLDAADEAHAVLDINGDELIAGETYYVMPHIWAVGGGLTLSKNKNGSMCPLDVVQSPFGIDNGIPLKISPILDKEDTVIRISTDVDIEFSATTICGQSSVWKLGDYDESVERSFITTGGVRGSVINRFRIQKHNEWGFRTTNKFVFCRGRALCQDIGLYLDNGIRRLSPEDHPFEVVFVKAHDFEIKKITDGLQTN